ncbi:MAG: tryptophan--tRNA ligase [Candidatus Pacebacteria bacterium]|nr:tryptophan--tRNA ligase [Candidatus Paceibacterota bacterium]
MRKRILTGDRPTGPLHLGHYVGSLKNRVELQKEYETFILIADVQALTDNFENPQKINDNLYEVALDYLSVGIDPAISTIVVQSMIPEIAELTIFLMNLETVGRLETNPTVKDEIKQKGFEKSLPVGFFCYPISQAADITAFKADLVPVGVDQLPMIESTRELVRKFNRLYGNTLIEPKALISEFSKLPGIDGAKMSKSLGNTINLSDSESEVKKKVMKMYTDPKRIHKDDPGQVEGNVVFVYHDAFNPNKKEVEEFKKLYREGKIGDVEIKERLIVVLNEFLDPIRKRRAEYASNMGAVKKILLDGIARGREVAGVTLKEVKQAMKINYF